MSIITPEMIKTLEEAKSREDAFFLRHGIESESDSDKTGIASVARRAWVKAVELEYKTMGRDVRVHLDTPLARKAFILGFRQAQLTPATLGGDE